MAWDKWLEKQKKEDPDGFKAKLKESRRKYRLAHKNEERLATLKWRKDNPEKWAAQLERNRLNNIVLVAKTKLKILDRYGAKCNCCGNPDTRFLTIDHVEYGKHKRMSECERRRCGINVYRQIIREGFPKTFQILCMNCNWAKGVFGKCFHVIDREALDESAAVNGVA